MNLILVLDLSQWSTIQSKINDVIQVMVMSKLERTQLILGLEKSLKDAQDKVYLLCVCMCVLKCILYFNALFYYDFRCALR